MMDTPVQSPFNMVFNYVPREEAAQQFDLPLHMIEYWVSLRRVRIAEFKKEGEGKRSIYVNKDDVGSLKDVYDLSVDLLQSEDDDITYKDALIQFPDLSPEIINYLAVNCLIDCYIPSRDAWEDSTIRRSDLVSASKMLAEVKRFYKILLGRNQEFLARDSNNVHHKMLYMFAFFNVFRQYKFHPIEKINLKFITTVVNKNSRLEYREGFNILDLVLSGEINGVLGGINDIE